MQHGRKSKAQRFNGYKVAVATEASSDMILDVADVPASGSDGAHLVPAVQRIEEHASVTVERVIGDGAFGSGENLAACANYPAHPVDLLTPIARPQDGTVDKSAFQIDLEAGLATCPHGHTVVGQPTSQSPDQAGLRFTFPRAGCEACPEFAACVRSKSAGRTVQTGAYESYLQAQRKRQSLPEFRAEYRTRSRVERKQAELVQHGIRHTRYLGGGKRQLQRLWTGAVVNLKCLFRLAEIKNVDLRLTRYRLGASMA